MFNSSVSSPEPAADAPIELVASVDTPAATPDDPTTSGAPRFFDRHARATGRTVFGITLLVGACALVGDVLAHRHANAAMSLAVTWVSAFALAGIAMVFSPGRASDPSRTYAASFVLPAVGLALLLPISLHAIVMGIAGWLDAFDDWVRLSIPMTGAAHTVFAIMVARRARALATGGNPVSVARIFATTVIAAAIPGAVLFLIPPLLVALTGLAIVPLLVKMPDWIQRELAVASVPAAIAHYKKELAHV